MASLTAASHSLADLGSGKTPDNSTCQTVTGSFRRQTSAGTRLGSRPTSAPSSLTFGLH